MWCSAQASQSTTGLKKIGSNGAVIEDIYPHLPTFSPLSCLLYTLYSSQCMALLHSYFLFGNPEVKSLFDLLWFWFYETTVQLYWQRCTHDNGNHFACFVLNFRLDNVRLLDIHFYVNWGWQFITPRTILARNIYPALHLHI